MEILAIAQREVNFRVAEATVLVTVLRPPCSNAWPGSTAGQTWMVGLLGGKVLR